MSIFSLILTSESTEEISEQWFMEQFHEVRDGVKLESSKPSLSTWESAFTKNFKPIAERSNVEVYWEHIALRYAGDVKTDAERNYSEHLVLISNHGDFHGKEGLLASARHLNSHLPDTSYTEVDSVIQGDWVTERWGYHNKSSNIMVPDGIDTFLIKHGRIELMMINYNIVPATISHQDFLKHIDSDSKCRICINTVKGAVA